MSLRIGADGFSLPAGLAEDVVAILGRRGRGKTNTAVVFVEELHASGARFCVADPVGVWWGLKSSKDGRSAGIPVVVMGGDRTDRRDVPLEETAGRVIADFVADPSSPSVILDFRGFRKAQMTRFMTDFLEQLYQRNREPLHVVLDEADQFAPQRVMGETARLVGAAEDVCKMGRARGLHPIVITQRPAALNKNVLTQAGLLVCHQLTGPQDQKAIDEWIRANADEAQREKFLTTIPELPRGVAWFWQPEAPIFQRVHVRERKTFDSSATPKKGEEAKGPRAMASVDLDALKARIASTIERAKAEDPRELRRTIADLRAQLQKAQAAKPAPAPKAPRTVEKPVLKDAQVKRLELAIQKFEGTAEGAFNRLGELNRRVYEEAREIKAALAAARDTQRGAAGRTLAADGRSRAAVPHSSLKGVAQLPGGGPGPVGEPAGAGTSRPAPVVSRAPVAARRSGGDGDARVSRPQQEILDALAYFESIGVSAPSRRQVALVARVSAVSSGYEKNLSTLRTAGLLDYPGPNLAQLSADGRAQARATETPPSPEELHGAIYARVSRPQADLLRVLIASYPNFMNRAGLAEAAGVSETSSGFEKNVSTLRTLGLIRYPEQGAVVADPVLFLEGQHGQ